MTVPGPPVLDRGAAADAALTVRRALDLHGEDPLPCVVRVAEDHLGLDVVLAPLPTAWSGFYLPIRRGLIAVNSTHAVVRQRFTIAHELGHHVLGHGPAPRVLPVAETPVAVQADDGASGGEAASGEEATTSGATPVPAAPRTPSDPREQAANTFAAELLCPATAARGFVARHAPVGPDGDPRIDFDLVVRLSCAFGLSAWAVLMRLGTAGVLEHGPVRDGLQARVDAREHVPRYDALGLDALADELELVFRMGSRPRFPEGINADFLLAVVDPDRDPAKLPAPMRELRLLLGFDGGPA